MNHITGSELCWFALGLGVILITPAPLGLLIGGSALLILLIDYIYKKFEP